MLVNDIWFENFISKNKNVYLFRYTQKLNFVCVLHEPLRCKLQTNDHVKGIFKKKKSIFLLVDNISLHNIIIHYIILCC